MRKHIEFSIGALLVGCLVAACSGGSGGSLPSTPHGGTTPLQHQSVAFTISVPARTTNYVSASTKSVSIVETDGTASPSPAVVQNTTPGSSNCTTSGGATTCTISVNANVGSDTFLVKTFDQPDGAGNVLSSGTVQGTVVSGQANSFPLTLSGAVASITLIPADAYPQVAGTTTITAQAKDAGGNTIIGTYDSPITLTTTGSASFGTTGSLSASDSVATITLADSQTASFTVTGSADSKTGSVTLNPSSGIAYYGLGTDADATGGLRVTAGNDGKLYYTTAGKLQCNQNNFCYGSSGKLGQFDPSTHAFTEIDLPTYEALTPYQTADGAVWVSLSHTDGTTRKTDGFVGRLSGAFTDANLNVIPLPTASPDPGISRPRSFALGADGNLYLTGNTDHKIYKIPTSNPSTANITAVPIPSYTAQPGAELPFGSPAYPEGIAAASDGKLYIANNSATAPNVLQYDPTGATFTALTLPGTAQAQAPRYIITGSDGNLYQSSTGTCLSMPCGGALNALTIAGVFSPIGLPDAYSFPDDLASGSGFIAFTDLGEAALGTYDFASKEVRDYPIETYTTPCCTVWKGPQGVTVANDGSIWYITDGHYKTDGAVALAHVIMTANWSVWPSQDITITGAGSQAAQLVAVMENGDSGPFALHSSDSTVATIEAVTGESHDFHIVGVGPGSCTITITDKNGRTESIAVNVTTTDGTVQSRGRRAPGTSQQGGIF
jgi:hypothetical protein